MRIRNAVLIYVLVISFFSVYGQGREERYNLFWQNISLATSTEQPIATDTMVVMYTTRKLNANEKFFFASEFDNAGVVRSLLAICKNQKWRIFIMPDLNTAASYLPKNKNLVFYIEGMGKTFPLAMYRAAGLTTQYNVNVILYDYPTLRESLGPAKNYFFAQRHAKLTAPAFAKFMETINHLNNSDAAWLNGNHKSMFVHSMGNLIIKETISNKLAPNLNKDLIDRLILNAPCVSKRNHAAWIDSISFAKEIFVHHNKKDLQLRGARFLTGKTMLGTRIGNVPSKKARYMNFISILKRQHNGFLNKPGLPKIPMALHVHYTSLFQGEPIRLDNLPIN